MFKSKDKRLSRIAGHSIAELYILHDEFTNIILDEFAYMKDQKEAVLDMLILYVGIEKYKGKAKEALLHNMKDDFKLEFPWTRLFHEKLISLNQDADFVNILLSSVIGKRIFDSFLNFLEETEENLSVCGNVILGACRQLIKSSVIDNEIIWGLQDDISKMIISLYDATSNVEGNAKKISMECLELWDIMYEKLIGMARQLTKK